MKIVLFLLFTLSMATPALAQGKVNFQNNSLHWVYTSLGGPYLLGQGGQTLTIELWSGTSSTALSRVAVTDFTGQPGPGVWNGMTVTLPTAGGLTFFQIDIYNVAAGSYLVALMTPGDLAGSSGLFTTVSSSTIAYNSLVNHNSPANSTWADGTYNFDSYLPGARGAIMLDGPEPSTLGLGSVGLALMLLRRRAENREPRK